MNHYYHDQRGSAKADPRRPEEVPMEEWCKDYRDYAIKHGKDLRPIWEYTRDNKIKNKALKLKQRRERGSHK